MCSLENAFNSFITDEKHKEMLNKYEIQDKLIKEEYIITKDALLNKYNGLYKIIEKQNSKDSGD